MKANFPTRKSLLFGLTCQGVLIVAAFLWLIPITAPENLPGRVGIQEMHSDTILNITATQLVTVSNPSDAVNGDTTSIPNLIASPGPDGISFREALEASNNTPGEKIIEFDLGLAGSSIYLLAENSNWPILTGGDLTINGDINRDGVPDITLDGSNGQPDSPTSSAINIWSSNNTISGLAFKHFYGSAVQFGVPNFYDGNSMTLSGNRIISNTIEDSVIAVSPFGWVDFNDPNQVSNLTWQDTVIAGNRLMTTKDLIGGISLIAAGRTSHDNRILDVTVTDNTLIGYGVGIMLFAADTNSYWAGMPPPIQYADNNLIQGITVTNNVLESVIFKGIEIAAGNMGNSGNQVLDVTVGDNQISGERISESILGITIVSAGEGDVSDRRMKDNRIANLVVHGNKIEDTGFGIFARVGDTLFTDQSPGFTDNRLESLSITENVILRSYAGGISVWVGRSDSDFATYNNVASGITIQGNNVLTSTQTVWSTGIYIVGGLSTGGCSECVSGNLLEKLSVHNNLVTGYKYGLRVIGGDGTGAIFNTVSGVMLGNQFAQNIQPYQVAANNAGATDNQIEIEGLGYAFLPFTGRNAKP